MSRILQKILERDFGFAADELEALEELLVKEIERLKTLRIDRQPFKVWESNPKPLLPRREFGSYQAENCEEWPTEGVGLSPGRSAWKKWNLSGVDPFWKDRRSGGCTAPEPR